MNSFGPHVLLLWASGLCRCSSTNKAVTNLRPGYKWGSEAAATGVIPSPGRKPSKEYPGGPQLFLALLTLLPLVCHGAAVLTADPLHCAHRPFSAPAFTVLSIPRSHTFPQTVDLFYLSQSSHCHHKVF